MGNEKMMTKFSHFQEYAEAQFEHIEGKLGICKPRDSQTSKEWFSDRRKSQIFASTVTEGSEGASNEPMMCGTASIISDVGRPSVNRQRSAISMADPPRGNLSRRKSVGAMFPCNRLEHALAVVSVCDNDVN